jgi:hypothetical protein
LKKKIISGLVTVFYLSVIFLLLSCDDFNLIELLANDISLVPQEATLNLDETIDFEVSAGISPFRFSVSGGGTIISTSGLYTAPGSTGDVTVYVDDDRNRTAESYVTVVDAVNLEPVIVSTGIGGIIPFTISGGTGPYSVVLDPGLGTYNTGTDEYTAVAAGLDIIRVTDSLGQIAEAAVTVIDTLNLMIIPDIVEVQITDTIQFSASGGTSPYIYSQVSGAGSFNAATRIYTAPAVGGTTAVIRVTDSGIPTSLTADATIYIVVELLTINPSVAITLYVGDVFTFSASNGTPPYTFSILPGDEASGSIHSVTGVFTALEKDNNVTVIVTDANGNNDTCRVKIKD